MNADKLRKINNSLEEQLSESEKKDMTNIVVYLKSSHLSERDVELVRQDILGIILSAKERGEDMKQAIGGDYKQFCDDIIAASKPKSTAEKMKDICTTVLLSASSLLFIKLIFFTIDGVMAVLNDEAFNWNVPVSYLDIFFMAVAIAASWGIVAVILKDAFDENRRRTNIIFGVTFFSIIVVFCLMYVFHVGSGVLFKLNLVIGYILAALMYVAGKILVKNEK
ncbi:MAG: DUF1129 family protein [Clostridiales bacterium]|nr:DUF1129 family protein [Clostridiales bacterium]